MTDAVIVDGPSDARWTFLFAHGAGAPMDAPFMTRVASGLAEAGVRVVRFEFPFMAARREGRRPGPDRTPALEARWREVFARHGTSQVAVGGKSLGGRIASRLADELGAQAVACFGYPFHPAGRPERTRVAHLAELTTPTLILQGERDPMGRPEEVAGYALSPAVRVHWLPDGDHSLAPRKRSGHTAEENLAAAVAETVAFFDRLHPLAV